MSWPERMQQERAKTGVVFSLDSMDALRRSGRIGIVRQSVSTILNIRPVLRCQDGAVISLGTARGRTEQMKKLIDAMSNNPKQIVVNASQKLQQEQLFQQLLVHLRERFPKAQIAATASAQSSATIWAAERLAFRGWKNSSILKAGV